MMVKPCAVASFEISMDCPDGSKVAPDAFTRRREVLTIAWSPGPGPTSLSFDILDSRI